MRVEYSGKTSRFTTGQPEAFLTVLWGMACHTTPVVFEKRFRESLGEKIWVNIGKITAGKNVRVNIRKINEG